MKNLNLVNVQEAQEFKNLIAGGYVAKITVVEDKTDKEYLRVEYDIAEGEFKGYFGELFDRANFWGGNFIKSYKEKALPFFKGFITAVENSNKNYVFDNDETKLVGKLVGIVLGVEEYTGNDGSVKTRLYVSDVRSIDKIKKGDYKIPQKKIIERKDEFITIDTDEDLPF